MIAIGVHYGGPELRDTPLYCAIQCLVSALQKVRGNAAIHLNPVFHIGGSISGPVPFEGIRYGRFSRKLLRLEVQVSIPSKIVGINNPIEFLVNELRGCNAMAFEFFRTKGLMFPLREAEKLITDVVGQINADKRLSA